MVSSVGGRANLQATKYDVMQDFNKAYKSRS